MGLFFDGSPAFLQQYLLCASIWMLHSSVDEMVSEVSAAPLEVLSFVSLMDDLSIGTPLVGPSELAVTA